MAVSDIHIGEPARVELAEQLVHEFELPDPEPSQSRFVQMGDNGAEFTSVRPYEDAPELICEFPAEVPAPDIPEIKERQPLIGFRVLREGNRLILPEVANGLATVVGRGIQVMDDDEQYFVMWSRVGLQKESTDEITNGWHTDNNIIVVTFGVGTEYVLANQPPGAPSGTPMSFDSINMSKTWRAPTNSMIKKTGGTAHREPRVSTEELITAINTDTNKRTVVAISHVDRKRRIQPTQEAVAASVLLDGQEIIFSHQEYLQRGIVA